MAITDTKVMLCGDECELVERLDLKKEKQISNEKNRTHISFFIRLLPRLVIETLLRRHGRHDALIFLKFSLGGTK